ncbi:hypothetical protein NL526_29430, partial [Klebsiella pneumoniae]|nr:hypothetical protein [Klebsiella pneumoniae]
HAWVEVLLPPEDVPAGALLPHERNAYGAWLRLDPTPASGEEELDGAAIGVLARVGEFIDYAQTMWTEYVLGLNSERQEKSIYR